MTDQDQDQARPQEPLTTEEIIFARGSKYGTFVNVSELTLAFHGVMFDALAVRGKRLASDQLLASQMILHKLARMINGDSDYTDNWDDIAGYATLVSKRLRGEVV